MRWIYFILIIIYLNRILSQKDTLSQVKASRLSIYVGTGGGFYFYDIPNFVNHKGSFAFNGLVRYHIFVLSTYATFSPNTNFGMMIDDYINIGLIFNLYKKNVLMHIYTGTNIIGRSTKTYSYPKSEYVINRNNNSMFWTSYIQFVNYENYLNGLLNPGVQFLLKCKSIYISLNVNYFRYIFHRGGTTLPDSVDLMGNGRTFSEIDRNPPYFGKNFNFLLGVNFKIK